MKTVIEKPDFKITSNLNSYLFGIARNIWLTKLRQHSFNFEEMNEQNDIEYDEVGIDIQIISQEKISY